MSAHASTHWVWMTSMPSQAKTASKLAENLVSRSGIKNRNPENRSASSLAPLSDALGGGVGCDPSQMHPLGGELYEDAHVETAEQQRVHGEKVTGQHAFGLGGEELGPGGPGPPGSRVHAISAQGRPHSGRRHPKAQPDQLPLDPTRAHPGFSLARQTTSRAMAAAVGGRPGPRRRRSTPWATRRRCQRSSDSAWTRNAAQLWRGSTRLRVARMARSASSKCAWPTWRRKTATWWRSTSISTSLASAA